MERLLSSLHRFISACSRQARQSSEIGLRFLVVCSWQAHRRRELCKSLWLDNLGDVSISIRRRTRTSAALASSLHAHVLVIAGWALPARVSRYLSARHSGFPLFCLMSYCLSTSEVTQLRSTLSLLHLLCSSQFMLLGGLRMPRVQAQSSR